MWMAAAVSLVTIIAFVAVRAFSTFMRKPPRTPYDHAMGAYLERARARGLTEKEIQQELAMRRAYIKVRNAVSDAVLADPRFYDLALKKAVSEEATMLAKLDGKEVANRFRKWIGMLRTADILYQDAYDVMQLYVAKWTAEPHAPTEIEVASVTIIPPTR